MSRILAALATLLIGTSAQAALTCDGTGDYAANASIPNLDDFSISFWLKTTTTDGADANEAALGVLEDGTTEFIHVLLNTGAGGALDLGSTSFAVRVSGIDLYWFDNAAVYDGDWHHHLLTRTGATTAYYADGVSQSLTADVNMLDTGTMTFARFFAFCARNNRGTIQALSDIDIAEVALFDAVVSGTTIAQLQTRRPDKTDDVGNLARYWPLRADGTETVAADTMTFNADAAIIADHPFPYFASGPTFDSLDSNTVRVTYDADAVADQIHCAVWPVDTSAPADGAAVEAASGASGSAFEATTGASDTIDIDVSESPAHPYYDGYCALETGTSSYSSVGSGIDIEMDPASDCGAGADELCGSPVTLTSVVQGSIFAIADLNYDAQSANFVLDEWVTGGTSGAVGYVLADTDAGTTGTLQLWIVSGTFADDEALTGDGAGVFAPGAAVVNGVAAYYYAANDIVVAPFSVLPIDVPLIIADDGGTSYADSSGVRISALLIRVFDRSAQDYHAELVVWWDQEPGPSCQGQTISYVIKTGVEIGTADTQPIVFHDADPEVGQICGHPLGDALTASLYQGTLYTGLSLTSNVLGAGDTVADMDEDEDGEAWYFRVVSDVTGAATYQRIDGYAWDTLTLVDCTTAPLTGAECKSAVESQYLGAVTVNVTYEYSDTVAANDTISQDPAADAELAPFGEVNLVVSLGVQPEGGAGARRNIGIGIRIGL
jgi:hypothetical protein